MRHSGSGSGVLGDNGRLPVEEAGGPPGPLPVGAATEAKQDVGNASLASIDNKLTATNTKLDTLHADNLVIEGKQDTGNASLASIDAKVATEVTLASFKAENHADNLVIEGKQDTGNTSLASIDTKLTSTNTKLDTLHADFIVVEGKQDTGNASLASIDAKVATEVTLAAFKAENHADNLVIEGKQDTGNASLASIDSKLTSTNTKLDTLHTDLVTVEGKQDTGNASLASIDGKLPALGQHAKTGSVSVTMASDQDAIGTVKYTDVTPANQNITAADVGSSTAAGLNSQVFVFGTPTTNSTASFNISGMNTVRITTSGSWSGVLQAEISSNGVVWTPLRIHQTGGSLFIPTFNNNLMANANTGGAANFRIRATSFTSGTATISVTESPSTTNVYVANALKLIDSSASTEATIKAASTPAVATDTGVVVDIRPGTPITVSQSGTFNENVAQWGGANTSLGQKASASSVPMVLSSEQEAEIGAINETAPANDTASSGLNGRLQRLAQRITSLIALLPTSLGQKTMATSFAVTIASDQSALDVQPGQTAFAPTTVTVTTSATLISGSDATWRERILNNNSALTTVRVGNTNAVTTTTGWPLTPNSPYFEDKYTGDIYGIVASGTAVVSINGAKK